MNNFIGKIKTGMLFFKISFLILLLPAAALSQDIAGLWTGYLSTTEKTLPYEVVITREGNQYAGYSHISFQVNGKDIISVKKLKVSYEMRHLVLEDDDLLKDNFEKSAPRKISQTSELDIRKNGQQWVLEGNFKTRRTRTMRPAEGVIILYKNADPAHAQARIQPALAELKQTEALAVFKPLPPAPEIAKAAPPKETAPAPVATSPAPVATSPAPVKQPVVIAITATTAPPAPRPALAAPVAKSTTVPTAPPVAPVITKLPPPALPVLPAVDMSKRKVEVIDDITVYSDSLVFSLYDNGEVDGDTVSVVLNGKTIMSKLRLSTRAQTQTIYLTPELGDTLQIIMYAENMGLYPPNTGLLIIQDGSRRREVRFSGDLSRNAAIVLRRNK